jgi:tetratricopeptide (TPR) repeat protein
VNWAIEAVRLYTLQKRYDEAIRLCGDVLRMMDDTSMTQPDSVYPGRKGQATIHKLLGDTYKLAGDLRNAQREYQKAQSAIDGPK